MCARVGADLVVKVRSSRVSNIGCKESKDNRLNCSFDSLVKTKRWGRLNLTILLVQY